MAGGGDVRGRAPDRRSGNLSPRNDTKEAWKASGAEDLDVDRPKEDLGEVGEAHHERSGTAESCRRWDGLLRGGF